MLVENIQKIGAECETLFLRTQDAIYCERKVSIEMNGVPF